MNKSGPIVVIEDDQDDQDMMNEILNELGFRNSVIYFLDSEKALEFLLATDIEPFLILSDINMPRLSGMQLREMINTNEDLRIKCIPYLFFTTTAQQSYVVDAYSKSVQGFFVKPDSYDKLKRVMKLIIEYWLECESPNYVK